MKNLKHILIICVLLVIFFGLIFVASDTSDVKIEKKFYSKVSLSSNQYETKIGEIVYENQNRFIPVRVKMDEYIGCSNSTTNQDMLYKYGLIVQYSRIINEKHNLFEPIYQGFIELKPKEVEKVNLILNSPYYQFNQKFENQSLQEIYIFKIEDLKSQIYFCEGVDFSKAEAKIEIEVKS